MLEVDKLKKRITLPKDFGDLLKKGDVEALKAVYQKCDVNARSNRYAANAFAMTPLPREFAVWLKDQGADINLPDYYGDPPLFNHCSYYDGDAALLIELGADVHALGRTKETPLHHAARYCRYEAVEALLQHGANVNVRHEDRVWDRFYTPMEVALLEHRFALDTIVKVCKLLLEYGAEITETSKKAVARIGEQFEFHKSAYQDAEQLALYTTCLQWLYDTFDVTPAVPIELHDGVSPIVIQETEFEKQYDKLWNYLVPPSGCAKTAQGEAIRIAGKVANEILGNGGANWDKEYQKMLYALQRYLRMGNPLPQADLEQVGKLVIAVYRGSGFDEASELRKYAVAWVLANPAVLPVTPPNYAR